MKMAVKKSAKKPAAFDMSAIVAATQADSFVYTSAEAHAKALADGSVEVNTGMVNEAGEFATRATEKGIASVAAPKESKPKMTFQIDDNATLPPVSGRGNAGRTEIYPFDALKVGQSFFVPNTEDKPNIAKSLASTVSSAKRRYAEEIPGETRTDRKGNVVAALKFTRVFELRARSAEDEAKEGFNHGMSGARIYRTA